jgi:hypothetical protein
VRRDELHAPRRAGTWYGVVRRHIGALGRCCLLFSFSGRGLRWLALF